jgi:hypothetical protein
MSTSVILIVIGTAVFFAGLFKLGKGQSGGLTFSNRAITFGGSTNQTNSVGSIAPDPTGSRKPDWIGLATAGLGLLTAVVGFLKALLTD